MKLPDVGFHPIDPSLIPAKTSKLERAPRRIMDLLIKGSETPLAEAKKSWSLDFRLSPTRFVGSPASEDRLSSMSFEKTSLVPDAFDRGAKAEGNKEFLELPASVAFRSIGYKSEALPGLDEVGVPFDDRLGIIPNDLQGRVVDAKEGPGGELTAKHVPGMYCAGWVKRGPTGVIASTMNDAFASADAIAKDWHSHVLFLNSESAERSSGLGWEGVKEEAEQRGCRRVSWEDWRRIDEAEKERGKSKGKEREKFTSIQEMLAVLD